MAAGTDKIEAHLTHLGIPLYTLPAELAQGTRRDIREDEIANKILRTQKVVPASHSVKVLF